MFEPIAQPLSIWGIWKTSFRLICQRWWLYPFFIIAQLLFFSLENYLLQRGGMPSGLLSISTLPKGFLAIDVASTFYLLFVCYFSYHQMGNILLGSPCSLFSSLKLVGRRYFILICASIFTALAIFLATLLLIIPGIFLAIALWIYPPLLIIENLSIWKAFKVAVGRMWGQWWRTFGVILLTAIVAAILMGLLGEVAFMLFINSKNVVVTEMMKIQTSIFSSYGIFIMLLTAFFSMFFVALQTVLWRNVSLRHSLKEQKAG